MKICDVLQIYKNNDGTINGKIAFDGEEAYIYGLPAEVECKDKIYCEKKEGKNYYLYRGMVVGEQLKEVTIDIINDAEKEDQFRTKVKAYLEGKDVKLDKFTVQSKTCYLSNDGKKHILNDNKLGYIAEHVVAQYIEKLDNRLEVHFWADDEKKREVERIVESNSCEESDIKIVKSYFYDQYDLQIKNRDNNELSVKIDVKSAGSSLEPKVDWTFQYPEIQAERPGKDGAILCYCIVNKEGRIIPWLIGYISEEDIKKGDKVSKGTLSEHGQEQRTDNFVTKMSQYQKISEWIKRLL